MKKPLTRKEQVQWLISKLGRDYGWSLAMKTDSEVVSEFESIYQAYQERHEDTGNEQNALLCLICEYEVEWSCSCGCEDKQPVLSVNDPSYESRLKAYEDEDEKLHSEFFNKLSEMNFLDTGNGHLLNPSFIQDFDLQTGVVTFSDQQIVVSPQYRASFIPFSK
ncbi:hypothetical protein [Bacillus sp. FJAT-28004]|uniref:hypothetical protein n=1 Tax=Bacillus sp. FJAT-28004 TaxID=1679165 RepID=UPI0006B41DE5|nr:hypothetical protein [Bacillus sp. FJAT-28004]